MQNSDVASHDCTYSALTPLPAPEDVTITGITTTTLTATWTKDDDAEGYEWKISTSSTAAGINALNTIAEGDQDDASLVGSTYTLSATSLTISGIYYFYVKAIGNGSTTAASSYSSDSNITPLVFSFTSNVDGWPTTSNSGTYNYVLNGNNWSFVLSDDLYCNSSYLMVKKEASLGLPAITGYKLVKVVGQLNSAGSPSTKSNVSVCSDTSGTAVSGGTAQTWSTKGGNYTYNLSGTSVNTRYYMYVDSSANSQWINVTLTYSK